METTFTIKGTHCRACKALIEEVSREIKGVQSCDVDFKTGMTTLRHSEPLDLELFKREIEKLGEYQVEINQE